MKTLLTLALFAAIVVAGLLPSAPINMTAADLLAGKNGTTGISRPRSDEQPVFDLDLSTLLAGRTGVGTISRPRSNEQPVFDLDPNTTLASGVIIGTIRRTRA